MTQITAIIIAAILITLILTAYGGSQRQLVRS